MATLSTLRKQLGTTISAEADKMDFYLAVAEKFNLMREKASATSAPPSKASSSSSIAVTLEVVAPKAALTSSSGSTRWTRTREALKWLKSLAFIEDKKVQAKAFEKFLEIEKEEEEEKEIRLTKLHMMRREIEIAKKTYQEVEKRKDFVVDYIFEIY